MRWVLTHNDIFTLPSLVQHCRGILAWLTEVLIADTADTALSECQSAALLLVAESLIAKRSELWNCDLDSMCPETGIQQQP